MNVVSGLPLEPRKAATTKELPTTHGKGSTVNNGTTDLAHPEDENHGVDRPTASDQGGTVEQRRWADPPSQPDDFPARFDLEGQPTFVPKTVGTLGVAVHARTTLLTAPPGEAKTTMAIATGVDAAKSGKYVAIGDADNRYPEMRQWLLASGLTGEQAERVKVLSPDLLARALKPWTDQRKDDPLNELVEQVHLCSVVVLDGFEGLLRMGEVPRHPAKVGAFVRDRLGCLRVGHALVLTDYPLRRELAVPRTRAGLQENVDVIWHLKVEEPYSRTQYGLIRARLGHDRTGVLPSGDRAFAVMHDEESTFVMETATGHNAVVEVIIGMIADNPYQLTGAEIDAATAREVPLVPRAMIRAQRQSLIFAGLVVVEERTRDENGKPMPRHVYGLRVSR